MAGYIEKEKKGDFLNPTSCTVEINPEDKCPCDPTQSEEQENIERWSWLINGWATMTLKEKIALFTPYVHHMNPRDTHRADFDEEINKEIVEIAYRLCRDYAGLLYDPDRQGIPSMMLVLKPIDPNKIPNVDVKTSVIAWGVRYGYISQKEAYGCCDCD